MCYDYVHLDNLCLSKPQRILVSSPQSAPVALSLAMYRDPLTGPIHYTITIIITELAYLSQCQFASQILC